MQGDTLSIKREHSVKFRRVGWSWLRLSLGEMIATSTTSNLLSAEPQPVLVDSHIETLFQSVKDETRTRYAIIHGESASAIRFAAGYKLEEALACLTGEGLAYHLKACVGDPSASVLAAAEGVHIVGLLIAESHEGVVELDDMVALDERPLVEQLYRFDPPEEQSEPSEPDLSGPAAEGAECTAGATGGDGSGGSAFGVAEQGSQVPQAVEVDERVEALCHAARAMAERASSSTSGAAVFEEFTPVEAMRVSAEDGDVAPKPIPSDPIRTKPTESRDLGCGIPGGAVLSPVRNIAGSWVLQELFTM